MNNFELPQITPESGGESGDKTREKASGAAESSPSTNQGQQAFPVLDVPAADTPVHVPVTQDDTDDSAQKAADQPGHEEHVIEKEWVSRAKNIIAQTKDDPHKQKSEIGKVKAQYIKKRFNKTIPVDDPVAQ